MSSAPRIAAVILAGGGGMRLGGVDKAALRVGGRTLLERVLERVAGQAGPVALALPGGDSRSAPDGVAVIADTLDPPGGPLGGLAAAGQWVAGLNARPDAVLSVPVDAPFIPLDLAVRAFELLAADVLAVAGAHSGNIYPLSALWRPDALGALPAHLDTTEDRRVFGFLETLNWRPLAFPADAPNPFANANTPRDLVALSARAG